MEEISHQHKSCGLVPVFKLLAKFESVDEAGNQMWGHFFDIAGNRLEFKYCPFCGKPISRDHLIPVDRAL